MLHLYVCLHFHFSGLLRQKDIEQALLLEEKMSLQLRLLAAAGIDPPSPPSYRHLVSENADTNQMWKDVLTAVHVSGSNAFPLQRFQFVKLIGGQSACERIIQDGDELITQR